MSKLIELRMRLIEKMEYVRQNPCDPANILRKAEIKVLEDQIRLLEKEAKK